MTAAQQPRLLAALAVVGLLLTAGCNPHRNQAALRGARPAVTPATASTPSQQPGVLDVPSEPPRPSTAAQRLADQAKRIFNFCQTWDNILALQEPRPGNLREMTNYARLYTTVLGEVDPTAPILHQGVKLRLSAATLAEMTADLTVEQDALYRFYYGVEQAAVVAKQAGPRSPALRRQLNAAFVQLAGPAYTRADAGLGQLYYTFC